MFIKRGRRHSVTIACFVLLIVLLMSDSCASVSARINEELEIEVSKDKPFTYNFSIDESGVIHVKLSKFLGQHQELGLVLKLPSGERKEIWYGEVGMPLSIIYRVTEEDIRTGIEQEENWEISVVNSLGKGEGSLKITYSNSSESATGPVPPIAKVIADKEEINEGESVSFDGSQSMDPDGHIVTYDWHFGDGSTGRGIKVRHTYPRSGTFTANLKVNAMLTVIDNEGLSDSDIVEVTVNSLIDSPNIRPEAYVEIKPNPVNEGEIVQFKGHGKDIDGEIVECQWTFPNGTTRLVSGNSDNFKVKDPEVGLYLFKVKDDDGKWSAEVFLELEPITMPIVEWSGILLGIAISVIIILVLTYSVNRIGTGKDR